MMKLIFWFDYGKKTELEEQKEKFVDGAVKKGIKKI